MIPLPAVPPPENLGLTPVDEQLRQTQQSDPRVTLIARILNAGLMDIDSDLETGTPRHIALIKNTNSIASKDPKFTDQYTPYLHAATIDLWRIAGGAVNYAEISGLNEKRFDTLEIIKSSAHRLLAPADAPNADWLRVFAAWSTYLGYPSYSRVISTQYFTLYETETGGGAPSIGYTSDALQDLKTIEKPNRGCPARGKLLGAMFKKYTETIFTPSSKAS